MTSQQVLDSIYAIPVLLDHFDNPTKATVDVLADLKISPETVQELKKIRHLLKYHNNIVQDNFEYQQYNYDILRYGLGEYFKQYLSCVWKKLGYFNKTARMLDYGCGDGSYSFEFAKLNPHSTILMMDKTTPEISQIEIDGIKVIDFIERDFEENPCWYTPYEHSFDIVLMAELLHCKEPTVQQYLMATAFRMLKPKGKIIIVENIDYVMAWRIGKIKGQVPMVLGYREIATLIRAHSLSLKNNFVINKHCVYEYQRVL